MKTCKTCKHWNGLNFYERQSPRYHGKNIDDLGTCDRMDEDRETFPRVVLNWVDLDATWTAALVTPVDFGCTLHEEREGEDHV